MRRRPFLAALSGSLAGCVTTRSTPTPTPTAEPTRTPSRIVETLDRPDPPAAPSAAEAAAYVRTAERVAVHNQLVRHGGGDPALSPQVGEPRAAVVVDAEEGFYLFGACEGEASYAERGHFGTNRHAVPYFVGDGVTKRAPWTAVVCDVRDSPYAASDPAENAVEPGTAPGAELRLYRFADDPAPVTVSVAFLDDGEATYVERKRVVESRGDDAEPPVPHVLSNLAVRRGTYRLTAAVDGGEATRTRWTLGADPDAPAWTSASVFVGPEGNPHVAVPDLTGSLRPTRSRCFQITEER